MRSRARRHTQSKGKLHQGYMSPHVKCVFLFQMVSWTVSTQTVVVSRCVWVPRCAKARLTHVTSFSRATPLSRHALHVSSSTVCDFSLDGTAHTYCQETCHLTAGDKHTLPNISLNTLSQHTSTHNLITGKTELDHDLSQILKDLMVWLWPYLHGHNFPIRFFTIVVRSHCDFG